MNEVVEQSQGELTLCRVTLMALLHSLVLPVKQICLPCLSSESCCTALYHNEADSDEVCVLCYIMQHLESRHIISPHVCFSASHSSAHCVLTRDIEMHSFIEPALSAPRLRQDGSHYLSRASVQSKLAQVYALPRTRL